jgi:hypothetical protein
LCISTVTAIAKVYDIPGNAFPQATSNALHLPPNRPSPKVISPQERWLE